jgi:predicted GIY-YIG superfamily endonuclease
MFIYCNRPKLMIFTSGFTPDLRRRMREHRHEHRGWLVYYYCEAYASEKDARLREQRLKHHGSGKVELKKRLQHSLLPVSQTEAGIPSSEVTGLDCRVP